MQNLEKFDNSNYEPGNLFLRSLWYLISEVFFNTFIPYPNFIKRFILKTFGAKVGKSVIIKPRVRIKYPWFLHIGDNSWIGEDVWIDNLDSVIIEENVCISQGVMIMSGSHNYKSENFDLITKNIIIESGAWLCAKSIVLQGVRCKKNSILASFSVASSSLDNDAIYKGNPAIKIKQRINRRS